MSVLSAPIAALDRRALSQAWYSALHLARNAPAPAAVAAKTGNAIESSVTRIIHEPHRKAARCANEREQRPVVARKQPVRAQAPLDRRATRSVLARKIEAAFLHPTRKMTRAAFSLQDDNAKVHVSMRQTPRGLALIAVCSPRVRETVARALEEARYALAARGITLEARIGE